ncbi:hypothetical protein FIV42_18980 [Persicimonas caeni]|uniref:Uncharacterized protein n=1 Tax=Persicimonas caeni TaxID=2292766 RepID=A0A4Y6PX83_PERCE|nr:hypothetical protein [Persicimonas caeni]QDG52749.1 hypothetical protein FIV42_18980 [Persicimonas caeni]QED33971.1 hypothetical protein FRD00_18975 [Persicimonas caeni]
MSGVDGQLDLLGGQAQVPQANNIHLLVVFVEAVEAGVRTVDALADKLDVDARTVRYYGDLARWLGFVRPKGKGEWEPTETGSLFADSVSARGRLFSRAVFSKDVIKLANQHKRQALDEGRELSTRDACLRAIERATELSESTARRRASSLASLLEAAYRPSRVEWESGEVLDDRRHPALEFEGESFLTALAVRHLGVRHRMQIGFPEQVVRFTANEAHKLERAHWKRASWQVEPNTQWFGSVPINDVTQGIAMRGGRDLRQLLVLAVPYVTMTCAFLALRDPLDRPLTSITDDMYGIRFWFHETDLGAPLEALGTLALELGLEPVDAPPHLAGVEDPHAAAAGDAGLLDVLLTSGICRRNDTVIEIAPGVRAEWREGSEDSPSILERLEPLKDEIFESLRRSGSR